MSSSENGALALGSVCGTLTALGDAPQEIVVEVAVGVGMLVFHPYVVAVGTGVTLPGSKLAE
jgi:hypothetical protein